MTENPYNNSHRFALIAAPFMRTNNYSNMKGELVMTVGTLATGILLTLVITSLKVIELLNEREREAFENSYLKNS